MPSTRTRTRLLIALGAAFLLSVATGAGLTALWSNPWSRAHLVILSGGYQGKDHAYFSARFGTPDSTYPSNGGSHTNVSWPLTFRQNDLSPMFLTVVFDQNGRAIKATVHSW